MKIRQTKKLAVLLPTYNAAPYLKESIDSVLNQTFTDFDLFVYDDCSTDATEEIISSYKDSRIFYIKNEKNIGVTKTLNKGLDYLLPHYKYVARMDADDWCFSERFEKQLYFMDENPEVIVCGTQGYWLKDMQQNPSEGWTYPVNSSYIKYYLLFGATFGHSSVVLRSQKMIEYNLRYDETKLSCQDWELWSRISKVGIMANLSDFLMKYRILENSNHRSLDKNNKHLEYRSRIISGYWEYFGCPFSEKEIYAFYFEEKKQSKRIFMTNTAKLITAFNAVFYQSKSELSFQDQGYFSYMLARRILSYWKRSGVSRKNLFIWFFILNRIEFMSKVRLVKSIIK
ncbi:glycosyltransferase family 2 protein [Flavobacterium sp. XS2P12]|uniref:glycosyltransferase family 2 protein n=1 Tax=Flavobacterium melibiosi TaxID=3398734 RepID=UPI003A86A7DC